MSASGKRELLRSIFDAAVAAAHPATCLPPSLPPAPPHGRLIVVAAGKAAGSMAEAAEAHYHHALGSRLTGIAVTRHGYGRPTKVIEMIEAGHPVPDARGLAAAERVLTLADGAKRGDLVLALLSGGASANWIAPADGVSLEDKRALTRALLASGATIGEINTVRKHLSRIKGGRLAARAYPAHVVSLAISDVPGDDPSIIGSGPTVPDASTLEDARAIVHARQLRPTAAIEAALESPANESPKPGDPVFSQATFHIIARPAEALAAAAEVARVAGYEPILLGADLEGEAREVAGQHAELALQCARDRRRTVILSGGELTVTLKGGGRGGPNQEYALALALALRAQKGISAVAGDTDGTDGGGGDSSDPAGAFVDETTLQRAKAVGLDPARFLADNDSTAFFRRIGDLLESGPTYTNVNDLRAIIVDT